MRTLKVKGESGNGSNYDILVSGEAEVVQNTSGDGDYANGGRITGSVGGGVDTYRFTGQVISMTVPADSWVTVDGQRLDGPETTPTTPTTPTRSTPAPTGGAAPSPAASTGPDTLAWIVPAVAILYAAYRAAQ